MSARQVISGNSGSFESKNHTESIRAALLVAGGGFLNVSVYSVSVYDEYILHVHLLVSIYQKSSFVLRLVSILQLWRQNCIAVLRSI